MREKIRWLFLGGLMAVLPLAMAGAEARKPGKPAAPPTIAKLAWLAGNWRMEKGGRVIDEQWMAPAGGVMLGMGRTVTKGRAEDHEFLQIREGPGGDLFYVMESMGQPEATFQNTSLAAGTVVFENPQHDFPQKISYTLQPDGSLLAAFEGPGPDGQPKRIEFPFRKVGN